MIKCSAMLLIRIFLRVLAVFLGGLIAVVVLYGALLFVAYPKTPDALIKDEPLKKVDAIVFLAGERDRFDYAVDLFRKGYAPLLYSPGGESPWMIRYIHQKASRLKGVTLAMSDIVPNGTYGEALNTEKFTRNHRLKSIILVTSPYHTYRAKWIFKQKLPHVQIVSAAVPYDHSYWDGATVPTDSARYASFKREQSKFLGYYVLYSWPIKWLDQISQK